GAAGALAGPRRPHYPRPPGLARREAPAAAEPGAGARRGQRGGPDVHRLHEGADRRSGEARRDLVRREGAPPLPRDFTCSRWILRISSNCLARLDPTPLWSILRTKGGR